MKKTALWISLLACVLFAFGASDHSRSPHNLELRRITYSQIQFGWDAPAVLEEITGYRIYRDGLLLTTVSETEFTDRNLEAGREYGYEVEGVTLGGAATGRSPLLTAATMTATPFQGHEMVESVVESTIELSAAQVTALSLCSAARTAFGSLFGTHLTLGALETDVLEEFVSEELTAIRGADRLTDEQRQTESTLLKQIMAKDFGGASFEEVYMHTKLGDLAERYRVKGHPLVAGTLFEGSLYYLSSDEDAVLNTLIRLGYLRKAEVSRDLPPEDIAAGIDAACAELARFRGYFPEPSDRSMAAVLNMAGNWRFNFFPEVLYYDWYDEGYFHSALAAAEELYRLEGSRRLYDRIAAWRLVELDLEFLGANDLPLSGRVKVTNVTAERGRGALIRSEAFSDERLFPLSAGRVTVPVYAGHIYEMYAYLDNGAGGEVVFGMPDLAAGDAGTIEYDYQGNAAGSPGEGYLRRIRLGELDYPYNLSYSQAVDVFTLHWDWVSPAGFELAGFRVCAADGSVAAAVSEPVASGLPLGEGGRYYVVAVSSDGRLSRPSRMIAVAPENQTPYRDFYDWLAEWFGDTPMLSTDDPDGDGIDNYHEFLNGSDPTRAPAAMPHAGMVTYGKATLQWDAPQELSPLLWEIRRNGVAVGETRESGFTDSGLVAGMSYLYQVRWHGADGSGSDWSAALTIRTLPPENFEHNVEFQQVVDLFNEMDLSLYDAPALTFGVKTAFASLFGTEIIFSQVDDEILNQLVDSELAFIRGNPVVLSEAERLLLRQELEEILHRDFAGGSFEHVYIHNKLEQLAEEYVRRYAADRSQLQYLEKARQLQEFSLKFLTAGNKAMMTGYARLADLELLELEADADPGTIMAAVERAIAWNLEFDRLYPEAANGDMLRLATIHSRKYFPRLLRYDDYHADFWSRTMQLAGAAAAASYNERTVRALNEVASWELGEVSLALINPEHCSGRLIIENISGQWRDGSDRREFSLSDVPEVLPVYAGQAYRVAVEVDVPGYPAWVSSWDMGIFNPGSEIRWDLYEDPVIVPAETGTMPELTLTLGMPRAPYNLTAEAGDDGFTLSWEWSNPDGFPADRFNIYRGEVLTGVSEIQELAGMSREIFADACYSYRVEAVAADGRKSPLSPALIVLPEFTEEALAYYRWKLYWFGTEAVDPDADPDGDGLTNYQEFRLGSNPLLAPPGDDYELPDRIPGALVRYYSPILSNLPDYATMWSFKEDLLAGFCFGYTTGDILTSGRKLNVGFAAEGYFEVTEPGTYHFYVSSDDGSRLSIDGAEAVLHNEMATQQEYLEEVFLSAGIHSFRVDYSQLDEGARLIVDWSGPGMPRRSFDLGVWYWEEMTPEMAEYLAWRKDSDRDGLADSLELRLGTDPYSRDSDGDGLSDYDEVMLHGTDPLNQDTNNDGISDYEAIKFGVTLDNLAFAEHLAISGKDFTGFTGFWSRMDDSALAEECRGALEYEFELTEPGLFKLLWKLAEAGFAAPETKIDIYLDGHWIGGKTMQMTPEEVCELSAYTPYLDAGTHHLRMVWDNYRYTSRLRVDGIVIYRTLAGMDHVPESSVIGSILASRNSTVSMPMITLKMDGVTPMPAQSNAGGNHPQAGVSRISPFCLTGESDYPELVRVAGTAPIRFGARDWAAEIELDPAGPVDVAIEFENGGLRETRKVFWQATDMLEADGSEISLRKGDSLLMTIAPKGNGSWVITSDSGQSWSGQVDEAVPVCFAEAGTVKLHGVFTAQGSGKTREADLTVHVVEYAFAREDVVCWTGWARDWEIPDGGGTVSYSFDERFRDVELQRDGDGQWLRSYIDDNKTRYVAARLKDGGALLDVHTASGISIYSSNKTYVREIATHADGSKTYEMLMIMSDPRPDVRLEMSIFVAGILFDDGSIHKTLHYEDFDGLGMARVRFIYAPQAQTSVCHTLRAYQDDDYIGTRTR